MSGRNTNDQIRNSCFAGASMGHDQVPTCQRSFLVNKGDMSFIIMLTYEIQFGSKTLPIKHFKYIIAQTTYIGWLYMA